MRASALLCALVAALSAAGAAALTQDDFKGKHVLLFITDQERETQHFPPGWEEANLPGLTRLKRNGVTFKRAYTNSCMCTAARSSLFSGYMPAQTSAYYTLETDMEVGQFPQNDLPKPFNQPGKPRNAIANLAQIAQAAGYETVYKGKFHLVRPTPPVGGNYTQADLAAYGYARWNPPDAGADQSLPEGGGNPLGGGDNDFRIMNSTGALGSVDEGALQYIREVLPFAKRPVFLVVSIVNPHDVLFYPSQYEASGYSPSLLTGPILPPGAANESLATKPFAQQYYQTMVVGNLGPAQNLTQQTNYINFYANLIKQSDEYLVNTLNTLDAVGLTDRTIIIRTADHGEMGMAHGTLIQKNFNMYEEATRIPLVYSNPKLWPTPKVSTALVSHIDMAPTLQSLLGVPRRNRYPHAGVDYSSLVMNPSFARPVQDYVMFIYGDYQSGQNSPPYPPGPAFIRGIREAEWKIAMYYSPDGSKDASTSVEWECYNLASDPLEVRNLAYPGMPMTPTERWHLDRLKAKLQRVTAARLGPLPGFEWDIDLSANTTAVPAPRQGPYATEAFGLVTGLPIGKGTLKSPHEIRIVWDNQPWQNRATGTFAVTARTGQIVGTVRASMTTNGNTLIYTGTARVTGGSGAYRGFTALPTPLTLLMTSTRDGKDGKVRIFGRVTTARVNGQLILAPLNPVTGQ